MPPLKVVVFDIIDTVFDLEPLRPRLEALGLPPTALDLLYASALRDSMALACANRFAPFLSIMKADLAGLLAVHELPADAGRIDDALSVMRAMPPHPDAKAAFTRLREAGLRVFALSNGAASSTKSLLEKGGMTDLVEQVLSTEDVKLSKPRPEVYLYAVETAKARPEELAMVACHPWDIAGAMAAGLRGGYVRRKLPFPDAIMTKPDVEAPDLLGVARALVDLA